MIEMLVQHHPPASSGNAAKHTACWPLTRRPPISKAPNQGTQPAHVRLPRRWTRGKKLRRASSLPFRPGHHVDRQPVEWRVRERSRGWSGLELSEALAKVAAHVAHHLWSREATPQRLAIRCQATDPLENFIATLGVE